MPSSTSSSRVRWAIRQVGLLAAFGIPCGLALEVVTRVDQKIRYDAPLIGDYTYESALYEEDEQGIRGKPYGRYEKWELNAHGLRGPDIASEKVDGTVRVATVGASETFGLFESPGHEWPRQLEEEVTAFLANPEVLNASIAGMGLRRRIDFFEKRIVQLEPDVALLMLEYSSYPGVVLAAERDSIRRAGHVEPARAVLGFSFTPRIVRKAKDAIIPRLPPVVRTAVQDFLIRSRVASARRDLGDQFGRFREVSAAEIREFERDLERFITFCQSRDVDVIVLLPALRLDEVTLRDYNANYPYIHETWIREAIEIFPPIARRIAAHSEVQVIDLAPSVEGHESELMMDMFHFNDEGANRIAKAAAQGVHRWWKRQT